jgi:hypothetical protein
LGMHDRHSYSFWYTKRFYWFRSDKIDWYGHMSNRLAFVVLFI